MARKRVTGGGAVGGGSRSIRKGPARDLGKERRWRERIARWRRSGLGVRAFCRRERLTEWCFYYWRGELSRRRPASYRERGAGQAQAMAASSRFVPLRVKSAAGSSMTTCPETAPPSDSGIALRADNGLLLQVERGFDASTLGRVLAVLGGTPC